jgi:hypothetical protein
MYITRVSFRSGLKIVKKARRQANGHFSATEYKVVSHDDWIKTHRGKCPEPVWKSRLDGPVQDPVKDPVEIDCKRCGNPNDQSGNRKRSGLEIANDLSRNPDIDLEVDSLNKTCLMKNATFQSLTEKTKFEPDRVSLQSERNHQMRELQEWKAANQKG